jgi:hypothetical protein
MVATVAVGLLAAAGVLSTVSVMNTTAEAVACGSIVSPDA